MADQLSYVIITPHSLLKSRTGGIISRLIARTGAELVGARMFAPSLELVKASQGAQVRLLNEVVRLRWIPNQPAGQVIESIQVGQRLGGKFVPGIAHV
jgi:nucleoside diphosphate kinase